MPIETSDYQEEPSSFRDLGSEFRENRATVREQIKTIESTLVQYNERMTRIESGIENDIEKIEKNFGKAIEEVKKNHNRLVTRLLWAIGIVFASLVIPVILHLLGVRT